MSTRLPIGAGSMLAILTIALAAWSARPGDTASSSPPEAYTGVITGWNLSAEGAVALRLTAVAQPDGVTTAEKNKSGITEASATKPGADSDAEAVKTHEGGFELWFVTPADRSETTRFEDLVLQSVLRIADQQVVTVTSTGSKDHHGETLADAIPINAIRWEK